jgi:nitrite reductase (NADH) small subunit/3-phenylpropionate/trans-cinnamate dioxygenase ferredoxin subunit
MSEFVTVAKVGEIPHGSGRAYTLHGRRIAVFFQDGAYFALGDTCPHMGASLAEGYVDAAGVVCPWHAWKFCLREGTWLDRPQAKVKTETYAVRVAGDEIQVQILTATAPRPDSMSAENRNMH